MLAIGELHQIEGVGVSVRQADVFAFGKLPASTLNFSHHHTSERTTLELVCRKYVARCVREQNFFNFDSIKYAMIRQML